jgi:hypothetical protein
MSRRIVAMIGVGLAIGIGASFGPPTQVTAQDPGTLVMTALRSAAAAGDPSAAATLADIEEFLSANHLDAAVVRATDVREAGQRGVIDLSARGLAPFWVDVYASADLATDASLSRYLAERRAAVVASEDSVVSGRLSFNGFVSVERLCEVRDAYGATIRDADVDLWLDGAWMGRAGYGPDQSDFWARDCAAITEDLRGIVRSGHPGDLLAIRSGDADLTVYGATMDVPMSGARAIDELKDVLLFDPANDLLAPWDGRAAHVRLAAPVDVFGAFVGAQVRAGALTYPYVPVP